MHARELGETTKTTQSNLLPQQMGPFLVGTCRKPKGNPCQTGPNCSLPRLGQCLHPGFAHHQQVQDLVDAVVQERPAVRQLNGAFSAWKQRKACRSGTRHYEWIHSSVALTQMVKYAKCPCYRIGGYKSGAISPCKRWAQQPAKNSVGSNAPHAPDSHTKVPQPEPALGDLGIDAQKSAVAHATHPVQLAVHKK